MPAGSRQKTKRPDPVQVRLSGSGGQGLILAGIILAAAAVADGFHVIQTQSYGPEARGGSSVAEVIIGSDPIDYPHVERADILLALTQQACDKYLPAVSGQALVILDAHLVETVPETGASVLRLPVVHTARNGIGKEVVANMVALGALNAASGLVAWPSLEQAVRERVPAGFFDLNQKALAAGRALVQELGTGPQDSPSEMP
ncbi:MAG: 2-oxoacid:acceptor oxidoreductase family protein [Peptococcaceae bacterium]|nr:2-oxoacid:acceptor oxidoreductase family protein [Peptococcaceae bacterium]